MNLEKLERTIDLITELEEDVQFGRISAQDILHDLDKIKRFVKVCGSDAEVANSAVDDLEDQLEALYIEMNDLENFINNLNT